MTNLEKYRSGFIESQKRIKQLERTIWYIEQDRDLYHLKRHETESFIKRLSSMVSIAHHGINEALAAPYRGRKLEETLRKMKAAGEKNTGVKSE